MVTKAEPIAHPKAASGSAAAVGLSVTFSSPPFCFARYNGAWWLYRAAGISPPVTPDSPLQTHIITRRGSLPLLPDGGGNNTLLSAACGEHQIKYGRGRRISRTFRAAGQVIVQALEDDSASRWYLSANSFRPLLLCTLVLLATLLFGLHPIAPDYACVIHSTSL